MSKFWFSALSFALVLVFATKSAISEDFYQDVLISNDLKLQDSADGAQDKASSLLNSQAHQIKIENIQPPLPFRFERQNGVDGKTAPHHTVPASQESVVTKYGEAPFGLAWGGSYNQIKSLGVNLVRTEIKDLPNSFFATTLPKDLPGFNQVVISFGENNLLWKITAYSIMLDDTPDASQALQIYRKYYDLLEQKYGNAQQFFTPKISTIEKVVKNKDGKDTTETTKVEEPIGNKNFLAQLQSGEAELYATFENHKVGAALSINVDGNGKSYVIINFTNLEIFKEREQKVLDAL